MDQTQPARPKSKLKFILIILVILVAITIIIYILYVKGIIVLNPTVDTSPSTSISASASSNAQFGCAKENEKVSEVYKDKYPSQCCTGLTDNKAGMDTSISIADKCYQTGLESGYPVGTCINCGDGICGQNENPCHCPKDCANKNKSDFNTVGEFCQNTSWKKQCENTNNELIKEVCNLCR